MTIRSIALLILLGVSAHADTLILRNGKRVTGRWWATDGKVISFLVNNRLEWYSQSDVVEVVFGDEPPANAPPAPQKR
jgi:hypothetical protein